MADITLTGTASNTETLDTTLRVLVEPDGLPLTGEWLQISWPSASQSSSNLVRMRLGSGADGGAVATDDDTISPGAGYRQMVYIGGASPICLAGSSAFAVTLRVI